MKLSGLVNIIFLLGLGTSSFGQSRTWVSSEYKTILRQQGVHPVVCSQWLNECSYEQTAALLQVIANEDLPVKPVLKFETKGSGEKPILGFALEQVGGQHFIEADLTGKGVKIGVIDGGFLKANTSPSLQHLFKDGLVMSYKDYITPQLKPYGGSAPLDDVHGTEVLLYVGGKNEEKKIQFGLATQSSYYLARTDHGAYEKRIEEDLLIHAMEEMHEAGVRLINISLGYAAGYVNPSENYSPADMDGKTSNIARAVDTAFFSKNMLVVVAAGNEGFDPKWKVLSTPGDARGALTVGATKLSIWDKMDYSSIGTPSLDYVKPEISCFATEGTSFSTPIITGIAAGIMEFDSSLTAAEVKEIIVRSGSYYPYGNNYVGYGVPRCAVILDILHNQSRERVAPETVSTSGDRYIIKANFQRNYVVAFHKNSNFNVVEREVYRPVKSKVKIDRHPDAVRTTVLVDNKVTEIFWDR